MTSHSMEAVDPAVRVTMQNGTDNWSAPRHGAVDEVPPLIYYSTCLSRGSDPTAWDKEQGGYWSDAAGRLSLPVGSVPEPESEVESEPGIEADEAEWPEFLGDPDEDGLTVPDEVEPDAPPVDEFTNETDNGWGATPDRDAWEGTDSSSGDFTFHRPSLAGFLPTPRGENDFSPSLNLVSPPWRVMPDVPRPSPTATIPAIQPGAFPPPSEAEKTLVIQLPPDMYELRRFTEEDLAPIDPPPLPDLGRRPALPGGK